MRTKNISELKSYAESICKNNGHTMIWSKIKPYSECQKCGHWLQYDKQDIGGTALENDCKQKIRDTSITQLII